MSFFYILGVLTIGAVIGTLNHLILRKRGLKLFTSIWIGGLSALVGGSIVKLLGLHVSGIFAVTSAVLVLFTFNTLKPKNKPLFGTDHGNS
jgi:uncharacterized membrane protein YeaQ/YmgE (transglycosylase-associated protein family)